MPSQNTTTIASGRPPAKALVLRLIETFPGVAGMRLLKYAYGKEIGHFRGKYDTAEEALMSAPVSMRSTWDDDSLVENGIPNFSQVHLFDWPILFQMQSHLQRGDLHTVTDFGGHIGVKFSAYGRWLNFPEDLVWQVVDVGAVIKAGRLRHESTKQLRFFERLEETENCDVLFCSGSLQYAGCTPEDLIVRLRQKPKVVLLNKISVSSKRGYYTVERYIKCLSFRIYGPTELEEQQKRLGYRLAASWKIHDRDIIVLHSGGIEVVEMVGEVWELADLPI